MINIISVFKIILETLISGSLQNSLKYFYHFITESYLFHNRSRSAIVQKHNERVWAVSEQDNGAAFYFSLPKSSIRKE